MAEARAECRKFGLRARASNWRQIIVMVPFALSYHIVLLILFLKKYKECALKKLFEFKKKRKYALIGELRQLLKYIK